jgi:signal transduction histidine kinase/CheY-like chemotaxis protein
VKLRSNLYLMVAGALAPVVVLAVAAAALLVQHERSTMEQEAIGRTRSAMSAIDAEIRGHLSAMQALAASRALEGGDMRAFYDETRRVLESQPGWLNVGLASADGSQLLDAVRPFGKPVPLTGDMTSYRLALDSGRPVISDIDVSPAVPQPTVRVRLPVMAQGSARYVLTVPLKPEIFGAVLAAQQLPQGWVIALADRKKRLIGRIPAVPVGTPVSESFRAAIERSPNGWFAGLTLEGTKTYTPYVTSAMSGWVLGIAIPARAVDAAANRTFVAMAVGIAAALALAVFLGWFMARRIVKPISMLAAAAEATGRGQRREYPDRMPIEELDSLAAALRQSARLMLERQDLVEREKQALQTSDRAKDEFLAMLSHELRNPLAALTAAAHVVKLAPPESEAAIKARAVIERQTKHMARLVGDLLDISRVAMGKVGLERERLDLNETLRKLLNVWRASGRLERHELVLDARTAWVYADRARIDQIVSNLLDNAIKFTPAGRRINVSLAEEDEWAVLRVADEGEGLAPGSAERMFGLFVQGERGLDRAAGGLGVGLALVKRLTELHGGTVSGASAGVGRGATFMVKLPAVQPPAPAAQPQPAERPAPPPRRVLIVEDNDDMRQMLHEALAFSGHEVREARDGATALAVAAELRPDVALIDIGLPDLDGYEVARRLRAAPGGRRMGLVALTGYGQPEDQRKAFDAGFDAHLTKPVAPERLKQVMAGLAA